MRHLLTPILFLFVTLVLSGCATVGPIGSITGGECRLVQTPTYAVRGKASYDQAWINRTTEALVDGCRQPRPKARPASLDALKAAAKPAAPAKPKQKSKVRDYLGV